jgi:hypothetical protein
VILPSLLLAVWPAFAQSSPVAGGVVSSKEWRVKRGAEKEEEFIGDVRYRTGATVFKSDWALYKHEAQTWDLRGRVAVDRTLESGDRVEARGDKAFARMKDKSGTMTDDNLVSFKRLPADGGEPDHAAGKKMEWAGRDKIALVGQARLWGPRLETWSDRADFADSTREVLLTGGRPVVRKFSGWAADDDWIGALKGDEVRAWQGQKRLAADGQVVGWLEFKGVKGLKQ